MQLVGLKLVFLLAVLIVGWIGASYPVLKGSASGGRLMGWGSAFSAGTFLGLGFIHMLAEAQNTWSELGWTYPIAYVLATAAFAASLFFEHVLLPDPAHALVHHQGHDCVEEHDDHTGSSRLYPYVLVVVLSLHSILAGLTLGTQDAFPAGLVILFAILIHKAAAGLALGVSLQGSGITGRRGLQLAGLFAVMTPIGVLLGLALEGVVVQTYQSYLDAAVLALAAGTFIYIASLIIIQDEFLRAGSRLAKWLFAMAGLALTAILAVWI